MVTAVHSRGVMTKRRPGPAPGQGHGKDDDQQDEQGLPHGLVLAVPVFFTLFFAHHVKKAQHGHTEGHDASQRAQGFMTFFGGVVIYFAKDILDMIL